MVIVAALLLLQKPSKLIEEILTPTTAFTVENLGADGMKAFLSPAEVTIARVYPAGSQALKGEILGPFKTRIVGIPIRLGSKERRVLETLVKKPIVDHLLL